MDSDVVPSMGVVDSGGADEGNGAADGAGTDGGGTDGGGTDGAGTDGAGTDGAGTDGAGTDGADARTARRGLLLREAPDPVRARIAELVSEVVGRIPTLDLPAPVRPVARFAPAKRARVGASTLLAAITGDDAFAVRVGEWWREHRPDDWAPDRADAVHSAAVAVIEARDEGAALVRDAEERADIGRVRAERDAALARAEKLAVEVDRVTGERDEARSAVEGAAARRHDEITKLRSRLREQGVRVRQAEDAAAEARAAVADDEGGLRRELEETRRERDRQQEAATAAADRARRLAAELDAARRASVEARRADDARLALLVDTVAGAAAGLRHELGLRSEDGRAGPRPAELVGGQHRAPLARVTDPVALDRLLALPEVHLLIDGYNVTKTGWPDLSLAAQRERLVAVVAPLSSRTGAETTVVFDGAGVTGVPTTSVRGVRVLFSEPGVIADDLIRSLVGAEPEGRPLVVVTSDRAVVDSVRRQGAHPVPSSVLLTRLSRI